MMIRRVLRATLFGCTFLALGCVGAPDDGDDELEPVGEAEQAASLVSTNGLSPGTLNAYLGLVRELASQKISADGVSFATTPMATTAEGRQLLRYIAACALPATKSLYLHPTQSSYDGSAYPGQFGFADVWLSTRLRDPNNALALRSAQRWFTACLLAHANAYGEHVNINVTANFGAGGRSPAAGYGVQEASFYGNMIQPEADPGVPEGLQSKEMMLACTGANANGVCAASPLAASLQRRICGASSTNCGFEVTGKCVDVCTGTSTAYGSCFTDPGFPYSRDFAEVITVYLQTTGMIETDVSCSGECAHLPTETGQPLNGACSPCVKSVCAADPYCCNNGWDSICVNEVPTYCTAPISNCGHSTLSTGVAMSASCSSCTQEVCTNDSYCCNVAWDSICVNEANAWCDKP